MTIFLAFCSTIASELCGQEEKWRVNYNIPESGHDSRVSYLTGKPLADKAHISTSPMFCYLKPYPHDVNKSYFRQLADGQL